MAETLNVYKGDELVKSAEYTDGQAIVTIDGLNANTSYKTGTYTVTRKNENGESEKVKVPGFKTKPIAVSGVTVEPTTMSLNVGEEGVLKATVTPSTATNKSISLASSNEDVATVNQNGHVTGVAPGQANITVTTEDGNKKATTKVTVNQPQSDSDESQE